MQQFPRWKVDVTVGGDVVKTVYETATTSAAAIAKAKHKIRGAVSNAGAFKFKAAKADAGGTVRHHVTKTKKTLDREIASALAQGAKGRKGRVVDVVCDTPTGYRWLRTHARGATVTPNGFAVTNEHDWAQSLAAAGGTEMTKRRTSHLGKAPKVPKPKRVPKTRIIFVVQGNYGYGHGWEDVTAAETRKEALQNLREYRENESAPFRMIRRREKIAS